MEERNDWKVLPEEGKEGVVVRRRVRAIPGSHESTNDNNVSNSPNSQQQQQQQQPRKKVLSKQQRMLQQIKEERNREREKEIMEYNHSNWSFDSGSILLCLKISWVVITIVGLLFYFYGPDLEGYFKKKPILVNRGIMTVYPETIPVRKDLPLFFRFYSLATPENQAAREANRHVAQHRQVLQDPGPFDQHIFLHAWEHEDFAQQIDRANITMDDFCGDGFQDNYQGASGTISAKKRDDLLIWCLLARGNHDGYVKFQTETIRSGITRGRTGVAIRYLHQKRIHSDSLLLLPIHDMKDVKHRRDKKLEPSTMVGFAALGWLRVHGGLEENEYTQRFEEFLFECIEREQGRWQIWNLACSPEDQNRLNDTEQLMGTICEKNNNGSENDEKVCCSFYDPKLNPTLQKHG